MGIQINGQTDTISATDGSLTIQGSSLGNITGGLNVTSGSVGIGTDNPADKLHVQNGAIVKDQYSDQNSANPGLQLKHNGTIYGSWRHDGRLEIGGQDSDAAIRLNPNGTAGIGTDNPNYKLHLHSATTGDSNYLQITHVDAGSANSDGLQLGLATGSSPDAYLAQKENADLIFQTNAANRARIDNSGQLLVNSTTSRTNVNTLEPRVQIEGVNNDTSTVAIISNNTADGTAAQLHFCKSSTGTVGSNGAVVQNELLGRIAFDGNDGTNFETGAAILSTMQSNASSGNVSAKLRFYTRGDGSSIREAVQINAGGFTKLKGNHDGFVSENGDSHEVLTNRSNDDCLINKTFNGGYVATNYMALAARSATSAYAFMYCVSGHTGSIDNEFRLMGDGNAYADGSWNGGGADYAEMFEWSDGNADAEDRRGLSVVLDGDKIREAVSGEDPIGVISGNPSVIGDAGWNKWNQKHLTDDYGSYIFEDHNVVEWTDELGNFHSYEDWSLPEDVVVPVDAITKTHDGKGNKLQHRAVNPDWDPDVTYIARAERKEWDAVGLMGKLRIRKGQVTGARWIKMRDISNTVEEWLVR